MKCFAAFYKYCLFFALLVLTSSLLWAQVLPVKGKVADAQSASPLQAATIQFYTGAQTKPIEGTVAKQSGAFVALLMPGKYFAVVQHSGYKPDTTALFEITGNSTGHDLGLIKLYASATTLQGVTVQAERSYMQLALDKKIFSVGQDLANAGGTATDVLTNIPSVTVDAEGSVKLRGSDNVRILIDGKPSGLVGIKGSGGLQGLPANLIDKVEIITNPSARYEAEGNAGIINIILKKEKRQGFNGSVDITTGHPVNYGLAANFNYRHRKLNFFLNYGASYRHQPGESNMYQEVYRPDSTLITKQDATFLLKGLNNNIRGGLDYFFNERSILTAAYLFRRSDAKRRADILYEDYLQTTTNLTGITNRNQNETEAEPNSEYTVNYKKVFSQDEHNLTATVKYIDNWESSDQLFTQNAYHSNGTPNQTGTVIQQSLNDEYEKQWLLQADYVQPIGKEGKFEAGLRSSFRRMTNDFLVQEKNASGVYVPLAGLEDIFNYDENIHGAYGILANKTGALSYQAGLRAEWTGVTTVLQKNNLRNPRDYANLFPSAHLTWNMPKDNAVQVSYSRRVRRPFYNDLSPFMTYSDSRNYFSGNPDLNPEFSDVGEIGYIKEFEQGSLSSGVYYRSTKGKIERIRQVNAVGNATTLPQNLRSEQAWGVEVAATWKPVAWWKLDGSANFFYASVDGSNILKTYKANTYSWFARQTSRFILPHSLELQLRANYEAPQKTVQGKRRSLYYFDFSASKDVFKNKGTLNFSVLDLFNTRWVRSVTNGPLFYTSSESQGRPRQINLTLNYRIRQSKPVPKKSDGEEG